ncbi:homeodomain-interacting protein kinase 2-like [Pseudoliparis swirei]|uniref:homeodomain-interacting protein kinase 2-like n=1 Tax=Pseudoliparis swirei TaxID=2059687 RepID=UPI0024BD7A55|nr:homeodomain-interacting protein kinase 2-like [Pseudoliparis swirei]
MASVIMVVFFSLRSPEVMLGLPYTEATDMWSVGCVAAFLYLGCLLYPGRSEYDMMRYIVETQGHPPNTLLTLGLKTGCFFQRNSKNSFWKLKTPEQFYRETGIWPLETRSNKFCSLYHLLPIQPIRSEKSVDIVSESTGRLYFGDILSRMLELDAAKRLTPRQVLQHPFTSMHHMSRRYHVSSYVRSCFETVYQNRTTDSGIAVGGSLQRSSSSAHRVQQNLPSASAERGAC